MRLSHYLHFLTFSLILLALTNCKNNKIILPDVSTDQDSGTVRIDSIQLRINKITKKINLAPARGDLLAKRAALYLVKGKRMLALEDMKKAVQIEPANYDYHLALGEIYFDLTDIARAAKTYKRCLVIDNTKDEAFLRLARLYLYQAKPRETIENINEALRRNKYNPEAYALKASYYLQMKDTVRAISNLVTSTEVDPGYFNSYIDLGYIYALQNDSRAVNYYANALRLQPGNIQVLYNLGKFLQDTEDYDSATSCYQQILEKIPEHKSANYNLGFINFLKNDFEKAAGYFSIALSANNSFVEAWLGRALCYDSLGRKEQAVKDYRKVIELDSTEKTARSALSKLIK